MSQKKSKVGRFAKSMPIQKFKRCCKVFRKHRLYTALLPMFRKGEVYVILTAAYRVKKNFLSDWHGLFQGDSPFSMGMAADGGILLVTKRVMKVFLTEGGS